MRDRFPDVPHELGSTSGAGGTLYVGHRKTGIRGNRFVIMAVCFVGLKPVCLITSQHVFLPGLIGLCGDRDLPVVRRL